MASSFIDFKDNGFWARDGFVESSQLLLFEEISNQYDDKIEWLNSYKKEIALESLPLISGGMSMCLDDTLIDESRREIIIKLIDNITLKISSEESYLTNQHLMSLRRTVRQFLVALKEVDWDETQIEKQVKDGAWVDPLPKHYYIQGLNLLKKLIIGQIAFKADTPITYWDN